MIKLIGISGSIREGSHNLACLRAAAELLPPDTALEIISIKDVPVFDGAVERQGFPDAVKRLREGAKAADAILFAAPEYNYSIPASLKAALEWASRPPEPPMGGKPCAIFGATTSPLGTMRGQSHLRQVCVSLNILALNAPQVDIAEAQKKIDAGGRLADEPSRELIRQLVAALVTFARRLKGER